MNADVRSLADHQPSSDPAGEVPRPVGRGRPRDPAVDVSILNATADMLGRVGYQRLTVDQVAARAGVGKASLYLRWPSKVALVADAIHHRAGVVPPIPDTGFLATDIREFLRTLLRAKQIGTGALGAAGTELSNHPELGEAWRRALAVTLLAALRCIIERAVDRGELSADTDIEVLSMVPLAMLQFWGQAQGKQPDRAVVDRIVDQLFIPARKASEIRGGCR